MAEVLEGVLSETILDELAADLGCDARLLRKHPFFRVLKGRVLLTYPLKVSECLFVAQFTAYAYADDLAAGATYVPPAGTIVMFADLVGTVQDLSIMNEASNVLPGGELPATSGGYIGATYCDGTRVGYKNINVAEKGLVLFGVSLA